MPFLVDSVTMALARHDLDSGLVVHPQLLVRRNVAGALREGIGPLSDIKTGGGPGGGGPGGGSASASGAGRGGRGDRPAQRQQDWWRPRWWWPRWWQRCR